MKTTNSRIYYVFKLRYSLYSLKPEKARKQMEIKELKT